MPVLETIPVDNLVQDVDMKPIETPLFDPLKPSDLVVS